MVVRNFSQYPSYGVVPPGALLGAGRRHSLGRTVMGIAIGALAFIRPCNETIAPAVTLAAATTVDAGGGWPSQAHAAAPAVGVLDPGESLLAPEPMGVVQQFATGSISTASSPDKVSASPPDALSAPEEVVLRAPVLTPPPPAPAERAAAPSAAPAPRAVTRPRAAALRREAALAASRPAHRVAPRKPLDLAAVAAAPARTRTVASSTAEAPSALGFRAPPPSCVPPFVFSLGADAWELCGGSRATGAAR